MLFSSRILVDSLNSSSFIQDGTSQCSLGINSAEMKVSIWSRDMAGLGHTVTAFCFRCIPCLPFELVRKRLVIEKGPRIVEFMIPSPFQVIHSFHHALQFAITNQGQDRCIDSC